MLRRTLAGPASLACLFLLSARAGATACPNVMLVLDQTGSMADNPNGGTNPPSKWELLQGAVDKVLTMYGDQLPFGAELFSTSGGFPNDAQCYADTKISVEPMHGTAAAIRKIVNGSSPTGGTNSGEAIRRAAADPALHDGNRGQYIILITDGDPNCNSNEPAYTINQIKTAARLNPPIHTFVIGFDGAGGVNPKNLNDMANAGGEPQAGCNGTTKPCYYSATSPQNLNDALQAILTVAVTGGEFGGQMTCDDSCVANGCDPGFVCVADEFSPPHCAPDACQGAMCNAGEYCRLGKCLTVCPACKTGEVCKDGQCQTDRCAGKSCAMGEACKPDTGGCVKDPCAGKTCSPGTFCDLGSGACIIDQCGSVTCPDGSKCERGGNCQANPGSGGTGPGPTTPGHKSGCSLAPGARTGFGALFPLAVFALLASVIVRRRRRR